MPLLAGWYLYVIPADSRSWLLGGSATMMMFVGIAAASSFLIAADAPGRSRVAWVAAAGRVVSVLGAVWLWKAGLSVSGPAVAWFGILVAASIVDTAAWLVATRRATDRVLAVATAGGAAALIAAAVVREAPRLGLIEIHPQAAGTGGAVAFFVALVLRIAAIAWVARQVRA